MLLRAEETLRAHVHDAKESSKGLRRLLKFGKKNHSSSVARSVDLEFHKLKNMKPPPMAMLHKRHLPISLYCHPFRSNPVKRSKHHSLKMLR
ncbi:hypothetical protein AAHA92_28845 [Salvia divinorum]|uniref:Uncharacterized protein n=1 Tax=Salvia divinorum TaxID=28513 RepID=A0ABD1FWE0_SALDI